MDSRVLQILSVFPARDPIDLLCGPTPVASTRESGWPGWKTGAGLCLHRGIPSASESWSLGRPTYRKRKVSRK